MQKEVSILNRDILERLAKHSKFAYGERHGSLANRKKAVIEIANFFIQELPSLISEIITCAKENHEVDIIVWGLDENPIGALFIHSMWHNECRLCMAVTFDESLVIGPRLEDPLYRYNKEHNLPTVIDQMKATMSIDTAAIKAVGSIDDKIDIPFPLDIMSFFGLMDHLCNAARTAKISSADSHLIFDLAQLGRNIL